MIAERIECGRRNGVHRIVANQFLDVNHVAVLWILRACAGPEYALAFRATLRQRIPARAAEQLFILCVGELRVGDCHLALDALQQSLLAGVAGGLHLRGYGVVDCGVDAADEEAGDAGDTADFLSTG